MVNGVRRVAVAEEDLTTVPGKAASYGDGFLEAHEGGHGLQFSGLTPAQQTQLQRPVHGADRVAGTADVRRRRRARPRPAGCGPAWYSASFKEEYFANSVAAFHGHPYTNGAADVAMYNQGWLQANDPGMLTLLQQVYAAPPTGGTP